jgi:hypothetical protein
LVVGYCIFYECLLRGDKFVKLLAGQAHISDTRRVVFYCLLLDRKSEQDIAGAATE